MFFAQQAGAGTGLLLPWVSWILKVRIRGLLLDLIDLTGVASIEPFADGVKVMFSSAVTSITPTN